MIELTPAQQSVVDAKTTNILVSAAAGSGKTAVLVERIMKKICNAEDPVDIDEVLIVTFTKDAASQMRERIRKAIDARLADDPYNKHLQRQSDRLSYAPIMTLDSFCQSVVKRYFHQLDIDPGFAVMDNTDRSLLWNRAVTETIEAGLESGDPEFFRMTEAYNDKSNDESLIALVGTIDTFSQSSPFPEDWIRDSVRKITSIQTEEDLLNSDFADSEYRMYHGIFESLLGEAKELARLCEPPYGTYFYKNAVDKDLAFCTELAEAGSLREMILRAQVYYSEKNNIGRNNKDPNVDPTLVEQVKNRRAALKESFDRLAPYAVEGCLSRLLESVKQSAGLLQTLCELVIACRKRFRQLMDEENAYDFSEISHMTLEILLKKEPDGSIGYTDAAMQYRRMYREIMVDEYQDSNLVQEMFLKAISKETEGRPNIFMVGDIKQSIYKFRMAKPELFMQKYDTYQEDVNSANRLIVLNKNFRSSKTILSGVNRVFRKFMIKPIGGVSYDEKAELKYGGSDEEEGSPIEYLLINRDAVSDEDAAVPAALVRRVKELTDPITGFIVKDDNGGHVATYRDIAVLSRKSTGDMHPCIEALLAAGIPAYAASLRGYFECTEVKNVLNLLKILDNPYDDIPFHAVMNSPIGGFTYEELALLRIYAKEQAKGRHTDYMITLLRKLGDAEYVTKELETVRTKAQEFIRLYDSLKQKSRFLSVPELLTESYRVTGYLSYVALMPAGAVRERNLLALVEKAKAFAEGIYTELSDFVRYIDDMKRYRIESDKDAYDAGDAVRFMTIHGSKGLEYPIVFLIDLGKEFAGGKDSKLIAMNAELGIGSAAIYPDRRFRRKSFVYNTILDRNRLEDQGEGLRLLYVAMTRAKEKMILIGGYKEKEWDNAIAKLPAAGSTEDFLHIQKVKKYQDLLLPAILSEADNAADIVKSDFMRVPGAPADREGEEAEDTTVFKQRTIQAKEYTLRLIGQEVFETGSKAAEKADEKEPVTEEMLREIRDFFTFDYPYPKNRVPVKVSVSDLKMSAMEEFASNTKHPGIISWEEHEEKIPVPKFAGKEQAAVSPGALRGTYYHRFLELHDYGKGDSAEELQKEAGELADGGYVPADLIELLSFEKLSAFLRSEIGQRIKKAFKAGKLKREQAFVMDVPADSVSGEYDRNEKVLVQGIIDAMFEEEDGIVLLDYKTDRVSEEDGEQLLLNRYTVQLRYYAEAIARGTGKNVKESCIYSFALQKTIRL